MRAQRKVVGLIGTGNVGVAAAYSMFQQRIASEIVLVDVNRQRAEGEAMDLMHAQSYVGRVTVRAGDYADLADSQVVVVTAGIAQRPGESRLSLLNRNAAVFREVATQLDAHAPDAIVIVASNPVDILTWVMQQLTRRPPERVIGTGTMLDTSRLRTLLGEHYGVDPRSVHAYIIGEHGDSEVPVWSQANIGGHSLLDETVLGRPFERGTMDAIFGQVRRAAYEIIERKGYTNTAIGLVIARLVQVVLDDQKSVLPVSVRQDGAYGVEDLCFSIPSVVGIDGIETSIRLDLSDSELALLHDSARILREGLAEIEFGPAEPELGDTVAPIG